jgi:hypothetical protein
MPIRASIITITITTITITLHDQGIDVRIVI